MSIGRSSVQERPLRCAAALRANARSRARAARWRHTRWSLRPFPERHQKHCQLRAALRQVRLTRASGRRLRLRAEVCVHSGRRRQRRLHLHLHRLLLLV